MRDWHLDDVKNVREAILQASLFLTDCGIEHAKLQAEVLFSYAAKWDRSKLFAELLTPLKQNDVVSQFENLVLRRGLHEPLQYLVMKQEFYGRDFYVNPAVLIPRPETECLVEACLKQIDRMSGSIKVLDIGTGSGAIAVTLSLERPDIEVYASDLSNQALNIARKNSEALQANVTFKQGSLVEPWTQNDRHQFQVVLSNPPYIAQQEFLYLCPEVKEFEPTMALVGGEDGLDFYRNILDELHVVLALDSPRLVMFEVGANQANPVLELIKQTGLFNNFGQIQDLAGIERVVFGSY